MDILTQYYNSGGQIVARSPDLTTREFYRDVMCRHRFNEMFVAANEDKQVGWYQTDSGIYIDCSTGESGSQMLYPNFTTTSPSEWDDGGYYSLDGWNGRKAIKPVPFYDMHIGLKKTWLCTNVCNQIIGDKIRIRAIAKNPTPSIYSDHYAGLYISFNADEFIWTEMYLKALGEYGGADVDIYLVGGSYSGLSLGWDSRYLFVDGQWHVYDFILNRNAPFTFCIDGSVVGTQEDGSYFQGVCTNPYIYTWMYTAAEELNFTLDSVSVESI